LWPLRAKAEAKAMEVTVLPVPPLWVATEIMVAGMFIKVYNTYKVIDFKG
jgi:hypothetical protein